jgi:hypothetical protein
VTIRAWADQFGKQTAEIDAALERRVFALFREADELLTLDPMPDENRHEWGWVVGHAGFYEFVAINRAMLLRSIKPRSARS